MGIFSQKDEHIYYDRREWMIGRIIKVFIFSLLVHVIVHLFVKGSPFNARLFILGTWYSFVFTLMFMLVFDGSLRITATTSKIRLWEGFLFSRTISYDEIVDIVFKASPTVINHREKLPSRKQRNFGVMIDETESSELVINLYNGDFCIIVTKHAQLVLTAIRKAQPNIKIKID